MSNLSADMRGELSAIRREWRSSAFDTFTERLEGWIKDAERLEAEVKAQASELARYANCESCGRVVDTREVDDGGDSFGAELPHGGYACSIECYDKANR